MLFCASNLAFGGHSWPPPRCSGVFSIDIPSRIVGDSPTHGEILVSWSLFSALKLEIIVFCKSQLWTPSVCCLPFCPINCFAQAHLGQLGEGNRGSWPPDLMGSYPQLQTSGCLNIFFDVSLTGWITC